MNKINSLRQEKDLTLKELANILGVSEATVSRWENGKSDIRGKNLKKLSDFFDVSESYLLGYVDYKEEIPIGDLVSAIFQEFSSTGYSTLLAMKYLSKKRQKEVRDFARFMVIQESKEDKNWQNDGYLLDRAHKFSKTLLEGLPPRP